MAVRLIVMFTALPGKGGEMAAALWSFQGACDDA